MQRNKQKPTDPQTASYFSSPIKVLLKLNSASPPLNKTLKVYTDVQEEVNISVPQWISPFASSAVIQAGVSLHGFEPSATTSMRNELRLMSRWSRWATKAQCMSRDFTHDTLAIKKNTCSVREKSKFDSP